MEGSLHIYFLFILLGLLTGASAIDDFTCITKPRIDIVNKDTYIAGYLHGSNGSISFHRTTYTYTGTDSPRMPTTLKLPSNYTVVTPEPTQEDETVSILQLPAAGGKTRIGVFACKKIARNVRSIRTTIMSKRADFLPIRVSQTVNLGDPVTLTVTATDSTRTDTRWRKDGSDDPIANQNGKLEYRVMNTTVIGSGSHVYEVHLAGKRSKGKQALMQLIVRGCMQNKWRLPSCDMDCPVCFNGGVCDDRSGICICPPGFSGDFCQNLLGPNRFGQTGRFRCDSSDLGDGPMCGRKLFCLPDPYGCSCAAGYQGIDCNNACSDGSYGADCAQTCHCMDGVSCDGTTGVCDDGECAPGYTGTNCQVCDTNTYGEDCRLCHCMDGVVCDGTTGECDGECAPGYTGVNCQDICLHLNGSVSCETTCTTLRDTGMEPRNVRHTKLDDHGGSVLSWDPVPCPNGSDIMNYVYRLHNETGSYRLQGGRAEGTTLRLDNLSPCDTRYSFQIAAKTSKGIGSYSSKYIFFTGTVPSPVQSLTVQPISPSDLRVSWEASANDAGNPCQVTEYTVFFNLLNSKLCGYSYRGTRTTKKTTRVEVILHDLYVYSTYEVYVEPRNDVGYGTATSTVEVTTLEKVPEVTPASPSTTSTSDSITVNWYPIPCSSRGGNITGYEARLSRSGSNVITKNVSTESVTFDGLSPCTTYTVYVRAYTSAGAGPGFTENVTMVTVAPDGVETLTLSASTGHNEFVVQWTARGATPDSHNPCLATSYNVTYELISLEQCEPQNPRVMTDVGVVYTTNVTLQLPANYSKYRVNVASVNEAGSGEIDFYDFTSDESVPTAAPFLGNTASRENITFSWDVIPCGSRGGNITHYEYRFGRNESGKYQAIKKENITKEVVTFHGLSACTSYSIRVRAYTLVGPGPWTNWTQQDTVEIDEIKTLTLKPSTNGIRASWITAGDEDNPCPVTSYNVSYQLLNMEQCKPQTNRALMNLIIVNGNSVKMTSLHAFSTYRVHVIPANNAGAAFKKVQTVRTNEGVPLVAPEFINVSSSGQSARVSWKPIPCGLRGGNITGYMYELLDSQGSLVETDDTTTESVVVNGLTQGAPYSFRVQAFTRVGSGPWMKVDVEILKDIQENESLQGSRFNWAVVVIIFVSLVVVIVLLVAVYIRRRRQQSGRLDGAEKTDDGSQATYANVGNKESTVYLNVELQNLPSTSGQPTTADLSSTSNNQPANDPSDVTCKAGLSTTSTETSTPGASTSTTSPVKPNPYIKSYQPKLKVAAKSTPSFSQTGPVAMVHIAEYILRKRSGKVNGFQQDFESLSREPLYSWTVAKKDHNKKKSRYNNILAYDHSRVVLECLEDNPTSDYINASYIHGYKNESRYIACQGPTSGSVNDMWRMVWQERVGKIVMLTNLVENGKGKCEKYWPEDQECGNYGGVFVRTVSESVSTNYLVRIFHLSMSRDLEGENREVIQFHYTTWSDIKPESSPLLQFVRKVQLSPTTQHGPIVVHCSAGVGRTGTFITLDSMLEMAEAEGQVDVLKFVRDMREQRFLMVQTLDQYKFIFDALLESSLLENTAIPADRFRQDHAKLKKRDKKTGASGIEAQFQMLETCTATSSDDQYIGGRDSANVDKNRFKDCIPKDSVRPYLMTPGEEDGTNYINATFLDGYTGKHAYLATQAPLPNTAADIWRMVFDYKSSCIVMLNSMDNDRSLARYWPSGTEGKQCGPLVITLRREDRRNKDIIIREFGVSHPFKKIHEVLDVCHIQYLRWPSGKEVPNFPSSLLKVLEAVKMWTNDHPDGPITVHCIDGLGCSGTFCALITLLDHLKEENIVDIFQTVKKLRTTRAGLVSTLAQYQLCYQVIEAYLDSSSIYENY